jgi:hypothetical protein
VSINDTMTPPPHLPSSALERLTVRQVAIQV